MLQSFVLRLVDRELTDGRLAGQVESVSTGQRLNFNDVQQLIDFCRQQAGQQIIELPLQPIHAPSVTGESE